MKQHVPTRTSRHFGDLARVMIACLAMAVAGCGTFTVDPIPNFPPEANAGADQYVETPGSAFTLSGLASTDPEGSPLTYTWQQTMGPTVALDGANAPTIEFVPAEGGTYGFTLTVSDGLASDQDTVFVYIGQNIVDGTPYADAGIDQSADSGAAVSLDGSNSADPDGDVLSFSWEQISGPEVSLSGRFTSGPTFTAPQTDETVQLVFKLTVEDETGLTDTDECIVTIGDDDDSDFCEELGLYSNGICNDDCPNVDPDCENNTENECETDGDCDDGLFCTGVEACVDGECTAGKSPCEDHETCDNDAQECLASDTLVLDLGNGVTMELIKIPAGSFMMGSEDGESNESPVHSVTISQDFYMGKYAVTQVQWQTVMDSTPWAGKAYVLERSDCAATHVTWHDAVQFCQALSASTGYDVRLPSEAEWEYATRAGTTTRYSFGDNSEHLDNYAWYETTAWDVGEKYAHAVGQKLPNPWQLYDVHGNVWEWCADRYDGDYYDWSPTVDPTGPTSGEEYLLRGGTWDNIAYDVRSTSRHSHDPDFHDHHVGFRIAAGT